MRTRWGVLGLLVALTVMAVAVRAAAPGDLVTLELRNDVRGGCGEERLEFFRVGSDGSVAASPFRVPEGRALVVTDVDWHYFGGAPLTMVALSLLVENLADPAKRRRAAESTVRLERDGVGGASERMTTGFAVSSEARLCVGLVNGTIGSPMRLSKVLVRGYLVNE